MVFLLVNVQFNILISSGVVIRRVWNRNAVIPHDTVFSVARVYAGVYDNYWVPYSLAGVLFASNIKGHRHWVSDMVAAAFIGTVIGEVVLDGYYGARADAISIMPLVSSEEVGMHFSKSF